MLPKIAITGLVAILMAGCAADPGPAATTTSESAPPPTVDEMTGSITGTVVDEEQKPLTGAAVSVGTMTASTDEAGAFTINGVEPGEYSVFVSVLGYEPGGKKVTVLAGEVATVQFILAAIEIVNAYHESFTKTGMVTGQWTVNYLQNTINRTEVDAIMCQCNWIIEFKPAIIDAVTDVYFKPSVTAPGLNEVIIVAYNKNMAQGDTYSGVASAEFSANGDTHHWSETQVKNLKGVPKARLQLHGPDPDNPGIAFQQRVELWQTWAWGEVLPEDFTMLPPK